MGGGTTDPRDCLEKHIFSLEGAGAPMSRFSWWKLLLRSQWTIFLRKFMLDTTVSPASWAYFVKTNVSVGTLHPFFLLPMH